MTIGNVFFTSWLEEYSNELDKYGVVVKGRGTIYY